MNRREFITLLGVAVCPVAASAQQPSVMRRIGAVPMQLNKTLRGLN